MKNENTQPIENKKLKPFEEAELKITQLNDNDFVVLTSCLAAGTKITMADGTRRNIEDIKAGDIVLSFDHEAGCFTGSMVHYIYHCIDKKAPFTLNFSDGTVLSIVGEHSMFEKESMKYVCISEEDAKEFVGRHFYSAEKKSFVELVGVTFETEKAEYYEIYTSRTLNMVANGMLNVADDVDYMLNIYEFDENLKADPKALDEDIEEYGLLEYSEAFGFTEQEFADWNVRYANIVSGKGLMSFDDMYVENDQFLRMR